MRLDESVLTELMVAEGHAADLRNRRTSFAHVHRGERASDELHDFVDELQTAQEQLFASDQQSLLIVLQGMDAAGKDGTIKHVMSGVNPQGCSVAAFKQPSSEELAHDFLWRVATRLPARGMISIFNRSHYEDVLVVRVHPELLRLPMADRTSSALPALWTTRFEDIRAFERHLHRNGTRVVKFFLHLSPEEQRSRLLARLDEPGKYWKFSEADLAERQYWDQYQAAYEDALSATSTADAPWYVIPADDKGSARALVAGTIVHVIQTMELTLPRPSPEKLAAITQARQRLDQEPNSSRFSPGFQP